MAQRLENKANSGGKYPEIPLEEDLANQRQIIIERLVRPLRIDEQDASSQLSFVFPERKPSYDQLHLRVPLIVPQFRGVSWLDAVNAVGFPVSDYLRSEIKAGRVQPWKDPRGIDIPDIPHGIWLQDGTLFVEMKPVDVREKLQKEANKDIHTGNLWRGLALGLLRPDMVENKGWDLIGDSVGSDSIPYLNGWDGGPRFGGGWDDDADPDYRAFVCGS